MSQVEVYQEIKAYLAGHVGEKMSQWTLNRLALLVSGILKGQSGAPAKIAEAGQQLSEKGTQAADVERRVRRIENDPKISYERCVLPLVKAQLAKSVNTEILLILDPSLQEDRVVLVSINAWYRGRSLPLAWTMWPANQPLEGEGFWQRIKTLLLVVSQVIPPGRKVIVLADRAFGSPAFTDLVAERGWHWLVRVQGQTLCCTVQGRIQTLASLVRRTGERRKLAGKVFKKAGWRQASVVVYWGHRHRAPLCLVSDLPPDWSLIALYRRRFSIEPTFRDLKSFGWQWELGQVSNLDHLERLMIGMVIATWLTLLVGALQAQRILTQPASGKRHTLPWSGKRSLFRLGLQLWAACFAEGLAPVFFDALPDWNAPNWSAQLYAHYAKAFIFA